MLTYETFVTKSETIDLLNAVMMEEAQNDRADDIVYTWTESTTSHNAACELRGINEKLLPRAGGFHCGRRDTVSDE